MRLAFLCLAWQLGFTANVWAQLKPVLPQHAPLSSDALGSPGIDAGDYVYVSGQGPRRPDGSTPPNFAEQVRQSLENVRTIVEAAGLTIDHVVYVQVYLEDMHQYGSLDKAFADYFPKGPPARGVLGVARLPERSVQINAVAVRDLKGKQPVVLPNVKPNPAYSLGMLTHDRLFVSTMLGTDPANGKGLANPGTQVDFALDRLKMVVEAAGLSLSHMVFVNPYLTSEIPMRIMNEHYARRFEFANTPGRATIEVSSLPEGAHIAYTGVAVRDLAQRRAIRPRNMPPSPTASPCVFAGDTLYCSAKSGFIPGSKWRGVCRNDHRSGSPDHAKSSRQPGRGGYEFRSSGLNHNLLGRSIGIGGVRKSVPKIFRWSLAGTNNGSTDPVRRPKT